MKARSRCPKFKLLLDKNQLVGIIISFCSLFWTSLNLFFSARVLEEKEDSPHWRFMLAVAPFVFLDLLASVVLLSLLAAFTNGLGLAITTLGIIAAIFMLLKMAKVQKDMEKKIPKGLEENVAQKEFLIQDIAQILNLYTFTSWIVNTVIVSIYLFNPHGWHLFC